MRVTAPKKLLAPIVATTLVVAALMGRPAHADIAPSLEADVSTSFEAVVMQQGGKKKSEDQNTVFGSGYFGSNSQAFGRTYRTSTNQSWGRPSAGTNVVGTSGSTGRPGTKTTGPSKRPTKWRDRGFVGTAYIPPPLSPLLP